MNSIRVSIVIVNWNRADDVVRCVRYLSRVHRPPFEIIVVDNGSTDDSTERLAAFEPIRLIRAGENLGPAAARNLGIQAATGEFILFLDSDALLSKHALQRLVERMDRDPRIGVIGCRVVNGYTRKLDQWIYAEPAETHERVEFETYSFSAAGALARASALRQAGCFWKDLFIYNEEVDISIRIIKHGYKIVYAPDSIVFHFASLPGRKGASSYWYYQIRNWIWIFYRYYPPLTRARKIATYSLLYLVKGLANRQLHACLAGIIAGASRTDLIGRFGTKLTREELRRLEQLNSRKGIRWAR